MFTIEILAKDRLCEPSSTLWHNQIRVDLHTKPGTLRHRNVALLVDCRRVAENRKALPVIANRRVLDELQQVASRPKCHQVQGGDGAQIRDGTVRCDLPIESLRQHPNLSQTSEAPDKHSFWLQDIEDAL